MKDLFGVFSGLQHMEKLGPGNNCWTLSKVVETTGVCLIHSKLPRWTPGEQLWTQHWCGVPVCCTHPSVGVGPGSSCWTYMWTDAQNSYWREKIAFIQNFSKYKYTTSSCVYSCYYSLSNAGEIETRFEVPQLYPVLMKRVWPGNSCWTPSEQVWAKLLLNRYVSVEACSRISTSMPVAVCMWKKQQHKIPIDLLIEPS